MANLHSTSDTTNTNWRIPGGSVAYNSMGKPCWAHVAPQARCVDSSGKRVARQSNTQNPGRLYALALIKAGQPSGNIGRTQQRVNCRPRPLPCDREKVARPQHEGCRSPGRLLIDGAQHIALSPVTPPRQPVRHTLSFLAQSGADPATHKNALNRWSVSCHICGR